MKLTENITLYIIYLFNITVLGQNDTLDNGGVVELASDQCTLDGNHVHMKAFSSTLLSQYSLNRSSTDAYHFLSIMAIYLLSDSYIIIHLSYISLISLKV